MCKNTTSQTPLRSLFPKSLAYLMMIFGSGRVHPALFTQQQQPSLKSSGAANLRVEAWKYNRSKKLEPAQQGVLEVVQLGGV